MNTFGLVLIYLLSFSISFINIVALWRLFKLNNKPGWASIIPVYNLIVMCQIAKVPLWYVILMFIPIANIIVSIILYINFAEKAGRTKAFGIGLIFLPSVFMPVLAFTKKNQVKEMNKTFYAILTILFGWTGLNKFYQGNIKGGLIRFAFFWTCVPLVLSIVEFITILTEKSNKKGMISVESERRNKTNFTAAIILFVLFILFAIIPWESLFTKSALFTDLNTWFNGLKLGKYSIFNSVIGAPVVTDATYGSSTGVIAVLGTWKITDVAILLFIVSAVIGLVNKIKFDDFISAATDNIKKVLPIAITAMLVSIVLVLMVTTGINVTITNWILGLASKFNVFIASIAAAIGSVFAGDFYYFVSTLGNVFATHAGSSNYYGVVAYLLQSIFYLMMLIAPTSVGLIIGLYYLDIPYNKWIKYIYKVFLIIFVVIIISSLIIYAAV